MITKKTLDKLEPVDISKDAGKTMERVRALWERTPKDKRAEVLALTGFSRPSVENVYRKGKIQPKIALALAQVAGVNPYYLTGESDEEQTYKDETLAQFLKDAKSRIAAAKPKKQKASKQDSQKKESSEESTDASAAYESAADEAVESEAPPSKSKKAETNAAPVIIPSDIKKELSKLTEEDLTKLVKGLWIQSKFNQEKEELLYEILFVLTQ